MQGIDIAKEDGSSAIDAIVKNALDKDSALAEEIKKQKEIDEAKKRAKDELEQASKNAKEGIDALDTLSSHEKQTAKDQIDVILKGAKEGIDDDKTTLDSVVILKNSALDSIKSILDDLKKVDDQNVLKNQLINDVQTKAQDAKDRIDGLSGLSEIEKEAFKQRIDSEVEKELNELRNNEINQVGQRGVVIEQIVIEAIAQSLKNEREDHPEKPTSPPVPIELGGNVLPGTNTNNGSVSPVVEPVTKQPAIEEKDVTKEQQNNVGKAKDGVIAKTNGQDTNIMQNMFVWIGIVILSLGFIFFIIRKRRNDQ